MSDLMSLRQDDGTFIISNKSGYSQCRFGINHGTSLLRAILQPARVKYDTLSAEMALNGTHWIIDVRGEVESCPGNFVMFQMFLFSCCHITEMSYVYALMYMFWYL